MLTKGAVEDLIMRHLSRLEPGGAVPAYRKVPELGKKVFLSDFELKKIFVPGARSIRVPANAILSPLALDWIEYNGVQVLRD